MLVLVNALDAIHPVEYGQRLAAETPDAKLVEIDAKEKDPDLHALEPRNAIEDFGADLHLEPFQLDSP